MTTISRTRTKQDIAVIFIGNAWTEGVAMDVVNTSSEPKINSCKKDKGQYEKKAGNSGLTTKCTVLANIAGGN